MADGNSILFEVITEKNSEIHLVIQYDCVAGLVTKRHYANPKPLYTATDAKVPVSLSRMCLIDRLIL